MLVTDCGSTTTKALLFERTAAGWRQTYRGEAPTTVEEPVADVTVGALNAFQEVQELSGRTILKSQSNGSHPFVLAHGAKPHGINLYLSTSSAGGGLQMMVGGLVSQMSAESAQRAALGAGAIVLDTLAADDGREDHERVERIRHLRPDIVLLTGGVDGGAKEQVIELAELLLAASPRPRFGDTLRLPVIYAGNRDAAEEVNALLSRVAEVSVVPNVRPEIGREELGPARHAIHEFFLSHVMSHSPGYGKLLSWSPVPVMPTPAAVGDIVHAHAKRTGLNILCADIGGATTDVFSVFRDPQGEQIFNRTVSANLGMSYSVANVLVEAGIDNIARWLHFECTPQELRDRLRNKMIRPTSIPQSLEDLWIEQAVCREALRLSLSHHRSLAVGLSGVQRQRGIADIFSQQENRESLVDMLKLDLVIGSGGVLSHAPERLSAALMMLDGFELAGLTELAVDSIFMMPHLGVFASLDADAAQEIFEHDCLISICHTVVPVYRGTPRELCEVRFDGHVVGVVMADEVRRIDIPPYRKGEIELLPLQRTVDVGAGPGTPLKKEIRSGQEGFLFDGRNRPLYHPVERAHRMTRQTATMQALGLHSGE